MIKLLNNNYIFYIFDSLTNAIPVTELNLSPSGLCTWNGNDLTIDGSSSDGTVPTIKDATNEYTWINDILRNAIKIASS